MVSGEKPNKSSTRSASASGKKPNRSATAVAQKTEQKHSLVGERRQRETEQRHSKNRTNLQGYPPQRRPKRGNWRHRLTRWGDEWQMALEGIWLALRRPKFVAVVVAVFLAFGTLMNLLTNGFSSFRLMAAVDFGGKMQILGGAFLANFGVGRSFWDWAFVFVVAILQGVLIGLVILVWKKRPLQPGAKHKRSQKVAKVPQNGKAAKNDPKNDADAVANGDDSENLQSAGIAAGLAVLSSGCPTCGTTLLAPVIGAISSTGGYALAGAVTGVIFVAAIAVALWSVRKVGCEAYAIMIVENSRQKKNGKK